MPCCDLNTTRAETKVSAYVADAVSALLSESGAGEVLMVNSSGIYLSFGGKIVFLCDAKMGLVPIGIAMEGFREVTASLCLKQGETFTYSQNRLSFACTSLFISAKEPKPQASDRETPKPRLILQAARELVALRKTSGLSMLALPLLLKGEASEVLTLNRYCTKAYPKIFELAQALSTDGEALFSCISGLLGLGTGLTPSADDVLLGMLYAFRALGVNAPKTSSAFGETIAELADALTNRVSAAYLHAIIDGARFERMEQLWLGLSGVKALDISVLTEIGSNSGSEMLLGVLLALSVCGYIE